jgi:protein-S-isoprenylcysteine O-methyltransferase Ste14
MTMPTHVYIVLVAGWLVWMTPFFLIKRTGVKARRVDRRARWGILLEAIAFSLLWQQRFWERSPEPWRLVVSVSLFALASLLSWSGTRALGRQWRVDAGVNRDHELVMSGPYRVVRHPIYASMLCLLVGTGLLVTPWPLLVISLVLFVIGTEIRVRIEDQLLAASFSDRFADYQRTTPAYIPFVR